MRESRVQGRRATRWNWTAFIWLAAFWAPVLGAFVHLLTQATDRLAMDAALVYVAALAVGLAAVTAACVIAHALLIAGVRWLARQHDVWRRPAAAGLCVAIGWLLAYEWTYWATRVAGAFAAPQPLPDALAHAVGLGIALAYLLVGMGIVGAPLLPAALPVRATAGAPPQMPLPTQSAPRLIAPRPYPLTPAASVAAPTPAASAASTTPAAPTVPRTVARTMPPPALDTPLVLRYPSRPIVAPAAHPPTPPSAAEPPPAARVVPVVVPIVPLAAAEPPPRATAPEPRTVPVLPPAAEPMTGESVRISTEIYLEIVDDGQPPA